MRISSTSQPVGMVDADLVAAKLRELADRVARVRQHVPQDPAALAADRDALDLVAFNLMLAVQSCLDLASHLIADEKWPPAATLGEAFQRLADREVLAPSTAAALRRAAGLRNIVAHGYAAANPALLHRAATEGLGDLASFEREVSAWVRARAGRQGT
jgi:uncharacterized protein YutE (UPF0331/DUF86 family)